MASGSEVPKYATTLVRKYTIVFAMQREKSSRNDTSPQSKVAKDKKNTAGSDTKHKNLFNPARSFSPKAPKSLLKKPNKIMAV
eukprot:CAMPEP_0197533924 /NCGR_PEP_ID=MMETSP1318-20131121/45260_1 /TAXON_ID=552666 /ORGANISM="Partenskyella glossopodia, Strain RCC365" /LENGTH=82 /DNA_ID=CAMNT_0043090989 /DNA_START=186 /DNA_END=431 /DNA_ORIENTATION=+